MPEDDDFLTRARPWRPKAKLPCPVTPEQKAFIETNMLWLADQFGRDLARREIAVPGPDYYPPDYRPELPYIRDLARRVASRMDAAPDRFEIRVFNSRLERKSGFAHRGHVIVGRYRWNGGAETIEVDVNHSRDPVTLTGIIAHELAHARLLGEKRLSRNSPNGEELTDLAAIFLGMGVFVAHASTSYKPLAQHLPADPGAEPNSVAMAVIGQSDVTYLNAGHLTAAEFGYALACLCGLRREADPAWAEYLPPPVRTMLWRSLAYFKRVAR